MNSIQSRESPNTRTSTTCSTANNTNNKPTFVMNNLNRRKTTATLVIENFSSRIYFQSTECSLNERTKFQVGLFPKVVIPGFENDGNVMAFLWCHDKAVHISVRFEVSILDESGEKRYSQEYYWNYNELSGQGIGKFIPRAKLLDAVNGFVRDGMLTVYFEVEVIDKQNSVTPHTECTTFTLPKANNKITEDFQCLMESGHHSDVVLFVRGSEFRVHKAILAARSPVFAAMFQHSQTLESLENRVEIPDVPVEVFELFLRYLYTGIVVSQKDQYVFELLAVGDKYQMDCLKSSCEVYLGSKLDAESAANILLLSDMYSAAQLKATCVDYITDHMTKVMQTGEWKTIATKPELLDELLHKLAEKSNR